jgi:hypothetical protein
MSTVVRCAAIVGTGSVLLIGILAAPWWLVAIMCLGIGGVGWEYDRRHRRAWWRS